MAKLYWHGNYPNKIPFDTLPINYIIRPTSGSSSQGVFVMKNGIDLKSGLKKTNNPSLLIRACTDMSAGSLCDTIYFSIQKNNRRQSVFHDN